MTRERDHEPSATPDVPPVVAAIGLSLREGLSARKHRFAGFVAAQLVLLGMLAVVIGLRDDLLAQPSTWLLTVVLAGVVGLFALPAIGVGLVFPSRAVGLALGVGGVLAITLAATGWPPVGELGLRDALALMPCWKPIAMAGAAGIAIAQTTRGFRERSRRASVCWTAFGVALGSMVLVTMVCSIDDAVHVVAAHVGPAVLVFSVATLVGAAIHRRAFPEQWAQRPRATVPRQ